jgi:hypothetical protein
MVNKADWMAWQKSVIKEEYNDLTFARKAADKAFDKAVKESLVKVKRNGN